MRRRRSPPVGIGLAFLLLLLAAGACVSSPSRSDRVPPDDERIVADLRAALAEDDRLPADAIAVDCRDGVVTLSGFLDDRDQVRRALRHAERIDGVVQVVNRLRVRGLPTAAAGSASAPS